MSEPLVLVEKSEGIATVTLNRPGSHNALSRALRSGMLDALRRLGADPAVQVIILTGAGDKAFSVGADLKELEAEPLRPEEVGVDCAVMQAFAAVGKPTIAAVNGFAVTGGFELAVNCDILVGSTRAAFADTHARVGIVPAWGLSQLLPLIVGPVRAKYLSFTGNYLDARTAKEWGLLLEVVSPEELLPYCRRLAAEIISCDRQTVGEIRCAIDRGLRSTVEEGLRVEARYAKDSTLRFDPATFAARRDAIVRRGKSQQR